MKNYLSLLILMPTIIDATMIYGFILGWLVRFQPQSFVKQLMSKKGAKWPLLY